MRYTNLVSAKAEDVVIHMGSSKLLSLLHTVRLSSYVFICGILQGQTKEQSENDINFLIYRVQLN